jgi:hypothetical protein
LSRLGYAVTQIDGFMTFNSLFIQRRASLLVVPKIVTIVETTVVDRCSEYHSSMFATDALNHPTHCKFRSRKVKQLVRCFSWRRFQNSNHLLPKYCFHSWPPDRAKIVSLIKSLARSELVSIHVPASRIAIQCLNLILLKSK